MTARAETVLPEPLSPTRPRVFPRGTEKLASSMTGSQVPRVRNSIRRFWTSSSAGIGRGSGAGRSSSGRPIPPHACRRPAPAAPARR